MGNLEAVHGHLFLSDDHNEHVDLIIVGFIPGRGPVHRFFSTLASAMNGKDRIDAWAVRSPGDFPGSIFGKWPAPAETKAAGIPEPTRTESLVSWLEKHGADVMEILRNKVSHYDTVTGEPRYLIGGHCDLTVVERRGVRIMRLRTWPDVIGKPIDPTRKAA